MGSLRVRHESDWPRVCRLLSQTQVPDCGLEVVVRRPKRTSKQNRLLWSLYQEFAHGLSDQTGEYVSAEQIHEVCKDYFLPKSPVPGFDVMVSGSTTELERSGDESFSDYLEQVIALAAERGIYLHAD